ncbi:MAG: hypothetical protein JWO95_601 [Verrucomicrobiales bacterium]|nr:hypothetical protein [Verrucomicrobiales bacterium]
MSHAHRPGGKCKIGNNMTRQQFEQVRLSIESERFHPSASDPLRFGIERAAFERQKFERLISAAEGLPFATAAAKRAQWLRQLQRVAATSERLEKLRAEIAAVRPTLRLPLVGGNLPYTRA